MAKAIVDAVVAALLLIGSIALWFVADAFPKFARYQSVDSDMWPKFVLTGIAVLAAIVLFQNGRKVAAELQMKKRAAESGESPKRKTINWQKMLIISGLCIGYFYALFYLGFIVSTMFFLYITVNWIGIPSKKARLLYPPLFTIGLALIFVKFLELSLPQGVGIYRSLSLLFY